MSTLYVDTINEKTSGNGVQIPGHVVQVGSSVTKVASITNFNGVTGPTAYMVVSRKQNLYSR